MLPNYCVSGRLAANTERTFMSLGPGGYLQWAESDMWDVRSEPYSPTMARALYKVNDERKARGLVHL